MRYWLVMPAAGAGRRFGERMPKQYTPLHGRTVLEWSLAPFLVGWSLRGGGGGDRAERYLVAEDF